MRRLWGLVPLFVSMCGLVAVARTGSVEPIPRARKLDFNRDVRPILTKCFECHGPDSGQGAGGLRLDAFQTATALLSSGRRAIVPGDAQASELFWRIRAIDDSIMPPRSTKRSLTSEEKDILSDWIVSGAEYKEHWAFVKPRAVPPPVVQDSSWPASGLDRFVLAQIEEQGLAPEPEADRATLMRRVSLDITGIPPTPQEVDAFINDRSPDAYEKVVDRLLASPRYGERMAMDWMDYSRYADSNGYQADYERYQSRWRDWVIQAFNKNMPYDQFTIEQIAGDMLPNATMEQKLATGFNRNHRINTEGGVIAEEWRVESVVDRLETTSAVWLGLTTGCARCHDHKYDPISQREFYEMYAFYNNVPESGTGEERPVNHPPLLSAPTAEQSRALAQYGLTIERTEKAMARLLPRNAQKARGWSMRSDVPVVSNGLVKRFGFRPDRKMAYKTYGEPKYEIGRATGAIVTTENDYLDLGNFADFDSDQAFSYGAWINPTKSESGSVLSRMDTKSAYQGWDFALGDGRVIAHLISKWTDDAVKIQSEDAIPLNQWTHVFLTYDGSKKASGFKMYWDGEPIKVSVPNDSLAGSIRTKVGVKVGRRTDGDYFYGQVDDVAIYSRELLPNEVRTLASAHPAMTLLQVPAPERTEDHWAELVRLWSIDYDKNYAKMYEENRSAKRQKERTERLVETVMVMEEMPKPRETKILIRGEYDKPGEAVDSGVPSFLPPLPKGAPNNRLGFAKWIASADNPLTARVTMNRLWERFFGTGIVATVEDFGTRAEYPSHPGLLDWLALEFVNSGWDLKAMVKEIVMSATYRQSSEASVEKRAVDPENRLLSRGPRFRLPGEVIRDQALFASGLLIEKVGGPSVRPYMPEGVWDETNFYGNLRNYKHDEGEGAFRRSLYTIWKRTAAPPNMLLFDVPSREACRVRRARTDTPLQALALMNDETYLEASRVMAARMMREGGDTVESRLAHGFRLVLCRKPTHEELALLKTGFVRRLERFRLEGVDPMELVSIGQSPLAIGLDRVELAAYTLTASTLLNLDETVTKE